MPKNSPRPICPKCGKPLHFVIVKTGGRKFRCIKCDDIDPMQVQTFKHGPSANYGRRKQHEGRLSWGLCTSNVACWHETDMPSA